MSVNEFKNRLNAFLIDSGMSKNSLSKTLNISQSQVSNWSNYGLKRWSKNSKKLDDYIQKYNQNSLPIPPKIEEKLRSILVENSHNETKILRILEAISSLIKSKDNDKK